MFDHGWFQVAFESDLTGELTPAEVGHHRLILVRRSGALRAYSADCPHRGAHLGHGGRLLGDHVECPFHGHRIRLGKAAGESAFAVREYPTVAASGLVFARLSESYDHDFAALLTEVQADHHLIPGFSLPIAAPPEAVIENGFDRRHFGSVHGVQAGEFTLTSDRAGRVEVRSIFEVPAVGRFVAEPGEDRAIVPYHATTISPGVIFVRLGGGNAYSILTSATPTTAGGCVVRLSLALPRASWGDDPQPEDYEFLLRHSRRGLEEDRDVWENVSSTSPRHLTDDDEPVVAFHRFCDLFRAGPQHVGAQEHG